MKNKLKNNKGITLIALIITIIVLLILAMVSINLVVNEGIIGHAQNAVNEYNTAQTNELEKLNAISNNISAIGKPWWEPTEQEEKEFYSEGEEHPQYGIANVVAMDENSGKGIVVQYKNNKLLYINIVVGGTYQEGDLFYIISDDFAQESELSKNKWYINEGSGLEEYTGEFPMPVENLTTVFSQSYLDKVINSFNK